MENVRTDLEKLNFLIQVDMLATQVLFYQCQLYARAIQKNMKSEVKSTEPASEVNTMTEGLKIIVLQEVKISIWFITRSRGYTRKL